MLLWLKFSMVSVPSVNEFTFVEVLIFLSVEFPILCLLSNVKNYLQLVFSDEIYYKSCKFDVTRL